MSDLALELRAWAGLGIKEMLLLVACCALATWADPAVVMLEALCRLFEGSSRQELHGCDMLLACAGSGVRFQGTDISARQKVAFAAQL